MAESCPIDHFMFASPDLAATAANIEERTGVRPTRAVGMRGRALTTCSYLSASAVTSS
jgi:hypothetical protein